MRSKKKNKSKNANLALYFILLIISIFLISVIFKVFDTLGKSKFDGKNRFTVAVLNNNYSDFISVSPIDGTITKLRIKDPLNTSDILNLSIPTDSIITSQSDLDVKIKSFFLELMFKKNKVKTDLTIIDLLRLSIFSNGVNKEKTIEKTLSVKNDRDLELFSSTLFTDTAISKEKKNIQITNATNVSGLGNKLAKHITNMGGIVVLVNTSSKEQKISKILFTDESYTVDKLSKRLNIPKEKNKDVSISDIVIIVGENRSTLFKY